MADKRRILAAALALAFLAMAAQARAMELHSPAFPANGRLPRLYACIVEGGKSISPPLEWTGVPAAAKSLAVTLQDLTSPRRVVHWVVYNIPPTITGLKAGAFGGPAAAGEPGRNQLGHLGYDGPCPRHPGQTNHYHFTLYALDRMISVKEATPAQLRSAMNGHIVAQAELVGLLAPPPGAAPAPAK